jgi:hypothetical protein
MNLPYPFESARDLELDESGKVLAHLPLDAAYELTPERNIHGFGGGYGYGFGNGYGYGRRSGEGRGKSP